MSFARLRPGRAWAEMDVDAGQRGGPAVLALLEGREADADVIRAARATAAPTERLVLVRVERPVVNGAPSGRYTDERVPAWEVRLSLERSAETELADVAAPLRRAGRPVDTRVCFGEPVEVLGSLADQERARAVVVASRGESWQPWARDRRLARRMGDRVHLVVREGRASARVSSPTGPWWNVGFFAARASRRAPE